MKLRANPFLRSAHFVAALALVASPVAHAASATWGSSTTGDWSLGTNWSPTTAPGATSGVTNTDLATFTNALGGAITIDSATQNIGSITNNSTVKYTIGSAGVNLGNSLFLSSGGAITTTGGAGLTVNAPLVLAPVSPTAAGSYTFSNTSGAAVMTIAGNVTGGTTTEGINLNLFGTNVTRGNSIVTGAISDGGAAGGLSVTAGDNGFTMWVLSGNNSYTGVTNVNGRLNIRSINALGSTVGGTVVTNNGNAALELQGTNITYAAEALSLSGTGNGGNGALRNISGDNTWTGAITLAGAASIVSTANKLTIDVASGNAITATNQNLTLGGPGNGEVKDAIATGSGTLTKEGAGTWTLSAANTYTGKTTISAGTLVLGNALATQNSALDTLNSIAGNSTAGLKTNQTALTLGGLTGNKNFAATGGVFTTTSGGYGNVTALTLNLGTGVTHTYTGVIENGAANMTLTKSGLGTQILGGNNTYTGATTLGGGTLSVAAIGNGSVAGNLGQATNAAANIVFDGGTLQYTGANATSDRAFTINTGKTATIDTANNISFAGATGAATNGALTKTGTGTLSLTGANTYTGRTTVTGGVLRLDNANALGTGSLLFNGAGSLGGVIGLTTATGDFTRSIVGNNPGAGQVGWTTGTTGGFAAFGGNRTVNFGGAITPTLVQWSNGSGVFAAGLILGHSTSDSTVTVVNPINLNTGSGRTVQVNDGSAAVDAVLAGVISGTTNITDTSSLVKTGSGTLQLTANNTYTGFTTISAGTLQVGNGGTTGTLGTLSVDSAITNNGTLVFNRSDTVTQGTNFANIISGTGILSQAGSGNLVLSGTNSYIGATAVNAGKLTVTGSIASSSSVTVSNGATLAGETSDLGVTNGKVSAITLTGGDATRGILSPGNGTAGDLGTLHGTSLAWNGAATATNSQMKFDLGSANASDKLVISGTMTKDTVTGSIFEWDFGGTGVFGNTYTLVTATGGFGTFDATDFTYKAGSLAPGLTSGTFTITGSNLTFSPIPEPTSALAGLLIGAGLLRRRRA